MYYKKYAILCIRKPVFHSFFSAIYVTHMEENELYWKLFFFSSLLSSLTTFMMDHAVIFWGLGHFVLLLSSPFLSPLMLHFCNDEVKRKERKKRAEWFNIFSTHNMLFHFISYVRNVIVVEGQYFTRNFFLYIISFFFLISAFLNYIRVYSQYIYTRYVA